MNFRLSLRAVAVLTLPLVACAAISQLTVGVHAQKPDKTRSADATSIARSDAQTTAPANNVEYGAKVKANTTESYFMTELVDHLPASDKVPSPDKILGYTVGEPGHLTYSKDLYRYYNELAKASPRVRV